MITTGNRVFTLVLVLLACAFGPSAWCPQVLGQGTMNQVADPMNGRELARLLDRYVGPSFEQWVAIEDAQDVYREDFARLRDGRIAKFVEWFSSIKWSGASRQQWVEYMRKIKDADARIQELDTVLFESISLVLTEDQLPGLERARLARERIRLRSGMSGGWGMGFARDLWDSITLARLDEKQLELIDEELRAYEEQLTRILRAWKRETARAVITMFDQMAARDFGGMDGADWSDMSPEQRQAYMRANQESFKIAIEKAAEEGKKNRALDARTLKKICALLSADDRRILKEHYVAPSTRGGPPPVFKSEEKKDPRTVQLRCPVESIDLIVKEENLPGEMRERLLAMRQAYVTQQEEELDLVLKHLKAIDPMELWIEGMAGPNATENAQEVESSASAKHMEEVREIRSQASGRYFRASNALVETTLELEDPEFEWIRLLAADAEGFLTNPEAERAHLEALEKDDEEARRQPWVVSAMDVRDVSLLRRLLAFEDWQSVVLETLHDEYLTDWRESVVALEQEISGKLSRAYSDQQIAKWVDDSQRRCSAIAYELDEAFFNDLLLVVSEESSDLVHVGKLARMYEHTLVGYDDPASQIPNQGVIARAREANPVRLVLAMEMDPETRARLVTVLLRDSEGFLESARAVRDKRFENLNRLNTSIRENVRHTARKGAVSFFASKPVNSWWDIRDRNVEELAPLILQAEAQRELFFQNLASVMSNDSFEEFKKSWQAETYPEIYRHRSSVLPALQQARSMGTVSQEQISRILALEAEYAQEWDELCAHFIKLNQESIQRIDSHEGLSPSAEEIRTARLEQLQFRRDDLNTRTLRRLALYLEPEQRDRIRALRRLET